jgi:D-3-phosphoglycerate dehydrogenase
MMKIVVTERIAEVGIYYLRENGFEVNACFGIAQADLMREIGRYDGLIVRSTTQVNQALLERAPHLKIVGRAGNGLDNIDLPACTARGIPVVNTPAANAVSMAEMAVALIFSVFRNIPQAYRAGKNRDFRRSTFCGGELEGKTAGIVGLGRIGALVAGKLKALGLRVIAYDPYVADDTFAELGVEKCEQLSALLRRADIVSLHVPKNAETTDLIGAHELELCKPGIRLVSTSRSGIINEKALYSALRSGRVAAAGIDILDPEPNFELGPDEQTYWHPLLDLPNAIVTPHMGATTEEAEHKISMKLARIIIQAFSGEAITSVNGISRPPATKE